MPNTRIPWLTVLLALTTAGAIAALVLVVRDRQKRSVVEAARRRAAEMVMVGDYARAEQAMTAALAVRPGDAALLEERASLRFAAGNFAGAIADADAAGGGVSALRIRGAARAASGDLDGALADLEKAIALDPADASAWASKADALRRKNDVAGALAAYDEAIRRDPKTARTRRDRAEMRFRNGDFEGARADADAAVAADAGNPEGWFLRACARRGLGDGKGALEDCRKALEVAPAEWGKRGDVEKWVESLEAEVQ